MEGRRLSRLGDQMQEEISEIIHRKLRDPRIGFVSVTKVKVAADLSQAHVYVSVMEQDAVEKTMTGLGGAASFIRTELGKRLRIKRIPELLFHHDDSAVRGARIDSILRSLKGNNNGEEVQDDS